MSFNIRDGITYDDVLLVPAYSTVESRSKVDISVKWGNLKYTHPIIPANMKTVTGPQMARAIAESGGLAILHRFMPLEEQVMEVNTIIDHFGADSIAASVGIQTADREAVQRFASLGCKMICIDIAHGDSEKCVEMISWIKSKYKKLFIIAGNVATASGAQRLWEAGADAVKVGVGPGSLCTTRIETGNGVPQLTALMDVAVRRKQLVHAEVINNINITNLGEFARALPVIERPLYIIADGGIKSAGDVVKALCFADMVMIGNLFAGCEETPGEIMQIDGRSFKHYVGSSTHKTNHVEGVAAMVPAKGKFKDVLTKLLEGLRSGCSYQGAHKLEELRDNPEFIRITNAGLKESHPHDVTIR